MTLPASHRAGLDGLWYGAALVALTAPERGGARPVPARWLSVGPDNVAARGLARRECAAAPGRRAVRQRAGGLRRMALRRRPGVVAATGTGWPAPDTARHHPARHAELAWTRPPPGNTRSGQQVRQPGNGSGPCTVARLTTCKGSNSQREKWAPATADWNDAARVTGPKRSIFPAQRPGPLFQRPEKAVPASSSDRGRCPIRTYVRRVRRSRCGALRAW